MGGEKFERHGKRVVGGVPAPQHPRALSGGQRGEGEEAGENEEDASRSVLLPAANLSPRAGPEGVQPALTALSFCDAEASQRTPSARAGAGGAPEASRGAQERVGDCGEREQGAARVAGPADPTDSEAVGGG